MLVHFTKSLSNSYHDEEGETVGDGEEEDDHHEEECHPQQLHQTLHSKERTHLELCGENIWSKLINGSRGKIFNYN